MKIGLGNFGQSTPQQVQPRVVADKNAGAIAQGASQLAQTTQQVVLGQQARDLQEFEKTKAEQERITSLKKLTDAKLESGRIGGELQRQVELGAIDSKGAQNEFSTQFSKFKQNSLSDVTDPTHKAMLDAQFGEYQAAQYGQFYQGERVAFENKAKSDFSGLYDNLLQLSATDPAGAKQRLADALQVAPFAPDEKTRIAQRGAQEIDGGQVRLQINNAGEDMSKLKAIQADLRTKDKFTGLQPDTKETWWGHVQSKIDQAENGAKVLANKRESTAKSMMTGAWQDLTTGLPIPAEKWQQWREGVQGTAQETRFNYIQKNYGQIQKFNGMTLDQKQVFVQALEAERERAQPKDPQQFDQILSFYKTAFNAQQTMATNKPMDFVAAKTGQVLPPIDVTTLATPQGQSAAIGQLIDRQRTVAATQRQNGALVGGSILYPQESAMVKDVIAKASDAEKLTIAATFAKASGNVSNYRATMKDIGGDNDAFMVAGMMQANGITTNNTRGRNIPLLVLQGQKVREDKAFALPPDDQLNSAVNAYLGNAVTAGTAEHTMYLKGVQYVYAGLASQAGRQYDKADKIAPLDGFADKFKGGSGTASYDQKAWTTDELLQTAIELTVGGVSEHAGGKVIRPYGMTESAFTTQIDAALQQAAKTQGIALDDIQDMRLVPTGRPTVFNVSDGMGGVQRGSTGRPVVVAVDPRTK
jgi:hypothetical protein